MQRKFSLAGANRTVLSLSFARMADAVGNSVMFIVIPLIVTELDAPLFPVPETLRAGILISIYGIISSIVQPFGGALTDRSGRRKIFIMLGLFIVGSGTLAFILANRFIEVLFFRSIQGIGVAIMIPAALAVIATSSEKSTRGGSMGIYSALRMAGLSIGPPVGGLLYDNYGTNSAFIVGAGFIFLAVIFVQLWVKDNPDEIKAKKVKTRLQIIHPDMLRIDIISLAMATFIIAITFSMVTPLEILFNERLNQSTFSFGLSFSAFLLSRLVFQFPFGRLSDLRGRKKVILFGLVFTAIITALLGYVRTTEQLIILRALQGIGSAAVAAPAFALVGDLATKGSEGRQMSVISMGFGLGIALGPLGAGFLVTYFFSLPFLVGAVLSLVACLVIFRFVPETVYPA